MIYYTRKIGQSIAFLLLDLWKVALLLAFVPAHSWAMAGPLSEGYPNVQLMPYDWSNILPSLNDLSIGYQDYKVQRGAVFPPLKVAFEREYRERTKKIRLAKNQGVLSLLTGSGIDRTEAYKIVQALSVHINVSSLPVAKEFELLISPDRKLDKITLRTGFAERLELVREGDSYSARQIKSTVDIRKKYVKGEISGSLYQSGKEAGVSVSALVKLNEIFSYSVDFQRQIRAGDQFSVFYDTLFDHQTGEEQLDRVLFAELILSGEKVTLYNFSAEESLGSEYFYPDGRGSRGFLMRTPLENARLSSYFGRRKHPVLGYTRMHKGLDFGAPLGTPILAAGDGVIERASYFGSFGNYIRIRHTSGIKTIYAHLKGYAKGINQGARVRQGQIIGYLGATGRVQGRHLHYEIHKNGIAVDPLRLNLPVSTALTGDDLQRFSQQVQNIQDELAKYAQSDLSDS
ncbi:peptidoglycan DD-metalloendopeptidase family protein [Microbulbifer sp. SSSA002]|uniref:peptidoglycan DD-metalloendopeptidase family protein n=1 Tax=unclassified Microbulbifer TaxID=2619833 RepID=UPI00403A6A03